MGFLDWSYTNANCFREIEYRIESCNLGGDISIFTLEENDSRLTVNAHEDRDKIGEHCVRLIGELIGET